jgi:hypothetical protein
LDSALFRLPEQGYLSGGGKAQNRTDTHYGAV